MRNLRAILVDDHPIVRAGIRAILQGLDGVVIVAEADNGREAVALAKQHRPDLVIMDISMKDLNGIEATAQIKAEVPQARVLILSMHTTEDFVRRALKVGASAYVVKDSAPLELQLAIDAALRNETYVSSRVSQHLVNALTGGPAAAQSSLDALSPRQREILQMIAEGRSTKEIAFTLELSVKTVESHRAALMDRLNIHDVAGLVLYAVRHNLVSADRAP
ncbi:MAG TPA: response regulator transcription factor [Usitatibacter sp.]|jgi:DNA-binding NarL/FixJ family response regulator|nr:response regulator transcription factor [Usitatibacter sp.]